MEQQEKKVLYSSLADVNYWNKALQGQYEPLNELLRTLSNRFVQLKKQYETTPADSHKARELAGQLADTEKEITVLAGLPKINHAFLSDMVKRLFASYQGDVDHMKFTYEDLLKGQEFEIAFQEQQLAAKNAQIAALKAEIEKLKQHKDQKPKKTSIYS